MTIVGVPGESVAGERRALGDERHMLVIAVAFGTINVVGGFLVTDRMLEMFKSKPQQRPAVAQDGPAPTSSNGAVTAAKGGAR